ncbi:MAG: hypothetical protein JO218_08620 [Burkholderiales bacterium]|nr:hypothetical protein [Burkholderiales bacterium]MBV8658450.1 hypothetical protein [Burkholderiales bacterium]
MQTLTGACHCGNLRFELDLTQAPTAYRPRLCDCDFCRKHGAGYLADPGGALRIAVKDEGQLRRYRQGADIADCLVCGNCGVLVAITYEDSGTLYGVVNVRALEGDVAMGEGQPVSPKTLSADDKVTRWKKLWFQRVAVRAGA